MNHFIENARLLFDVRLTERQVSALNRYEQELLDWNRKFNLTAIRDRESVRTKHFLDSISCVLAWKSQPPRRLVDVGTGAGFPGIPLKILYPNMQLTLIESVGKKAMFCQHIVGLLGLEKVDVVSGRVEDIGHQPNHRETYDWGIARAVANLKVLGEYLLPLIQVNGSMLAQKGESAPAEIQAAEKSVKMLGGKLKQLIPVNLPGVADDRYLVVIQKIAATPPRYPRKPGVPLRQPL